MPLLLLTGPPTTTSVTTSGPSTSTTLSRTLPSSIRIGSPGLTSPGSPSYVVPQIVCVARDVAGGDREPRALVEHVAAVGEGVQPDLRALEVGEDADPVPGGVRRLADQPVAALVVGVAAVAHVEPGDVHAGVDQLADLLRGRGGGAEGADDLGSTHAPSLPGLGSFQRRDPSEARPRTGQLQTTRGRSVGGIGTGRLVEPVRYSSTAAAAARPSAIAHTISDWPRPASPATKTPSTEAR